MKDAPETSSNDAVNLFRSINLARIINGQETLNSERDSDEDGRI